MSEAVSPISPVVEGPGVECDRLSGLLDDLACIEEQVAGLQARQVLLTAEFVEGMRVVQGPRYGWSSGSQTLAAMEVAAARRISLYAAESYLDHATRLVEDLPQVLGVLEAGLTSLDAVRAVAAEVVGLPPESRALADEVIADDIVGVLPGRVRALARTRVMEIDPDHAAVQAAANRVGRFVSMRQSGAVGMGTLTGFLPAEQAIACHQALDRDARAVRSGGDPRTVAQIMADTLVERVTGLSTASSVPAEVSLVMSDLTLLGLDDRPGQLLGGGPIPGQVARWLACRDSTWVRRLYTDPVDASVAVVDTRRRRYDGSLRELCVVRDQQCRAPGCSGRIRHIDHTIAHCVGGPTSASNGRGYTEHCHICRHHPSVHVETVGLGPAAVSGHAAYTRWQMPTGRVLASLPPPALGYGSTTRTQNAYRRQITQQVTDTTSDLIWPNPHADMSPAEQRFRTYFTLAS